MKANGAIWITGVGAATPLGSDFAGIGDGLLDGRSAVDLVRGFDASEHPCRVAAQVGSLPCPPGWDEAEFHSRPTPEQLVLWCCAAALRDSGWWDRRDTVRCGLILGQGAEWLRLWEEDWLQGGDWLYDTERPTEPLARRMLRQLGLSGPAVTLSAACASGNHALALAKRWLADTDGRIREPALRDGTSLEDFGLVGSPAMRARGTGCTPLSGTRIGRGQSGSNRPARKRRARRLQLATFAGLPCDGA